MKNYFDMKTRNTTDYVDHVIDKIKRNIASRLPLVISGDASQITKNESACWIRTHLLPLIPDESGF